MAVRTGDADEAVARDSAAAPGSAAVSWAPDIYNLSKIRGNRMLVNTQTANKLIADVWFARADFARPDFITYDTTLIFQWPAQPPKDPKGFQIQNENLLQSGDRDAIFRKKVSLILTIMAQDQASQTGQDPVSVKISRLYW